MTLTIGAALFIQRGVLVIGHAAAFVSPKTTHRHHKEPWCTHKLHIWSNTVPGKELRLPFHYFSISYRTVAAVVIVDPTRVACTTLSSPAAIA